MPTEDLIKVLNEYDIKVITIKNENYKVKKGVWWILTPEGNKILKKNSIATDRLEFIISAMDYLSSRGIFIPEIIKSKKGEKYVEIDGANYMLNQAIEGKAPSSKTEKGLERIIKELGKFHAASIGFKPPNNCKPNILLGSWEQKSRKQMNKLKEYYEAEKNKSAHEEFGQIILSQFPKFYNQMETSLIEHNNSQYDRWANDVENKGGLVHQDFIDGNLILTDTGEIYVLDPDSLAIELPIRDIRKFLNKVMKKNGGWNLNMTQNILMWYQETNPLQLWQWQVLKSTIMYPHLFAGIMGKYYQNREATWTESKYINKLREMIKIEDSKEIVIKNFENNVPYYNGRKESVSIDSKKYS